MKYIELFAGCGGMSLGLDAAGFELYFANELSPMASETFAYNLLQEDLNKLSTENQVSKNTLWIKSKYPKEQLKERLRENPFEATKGEYTDLAITTEFKNKLLVGDVDSLLTWFNNKSEVVKKIKDQNITLISGGPPCQSFSLAGKREKNSAKNLLPLSFAKFAGLIQPQFVILENVKGIIAPFNEKGKKYYAWFEVCKAFALQGFVPMCMLLNSKYFGIAQNRPRFILLAIRHDIAEKLYKKHNNKLLTESFSFYTEVINNEENPANVNYDSLHYYDVDENKNLYNGFIFPKIISPEGQYISAGEAIGDLKKTGIKSYNKSRLVYRDYLNLAFKKPISHKDNILENHVARSHNYDVKARFRLYQIISEFQNGNKKKAIDVIVGKQLDNEDLQKLVQEFKGKELYVKNGIEGYYKTLHNAEDIQQHLKSVATQKHSQRALKEDEPAPAQLTIPDDLCHYDMSQLRTLTVREMARFQSFPDWFVFKSKITTGGSNRKFEVPQYTQVGNAVPPLLAKALGETIKKILEEIKN